MVLAVRVLCLGAVLCPLFHAWGLDLTPRIPADEKPNPRFPRLEFRDGEQRVEYIRPDGWEYAGNSAKLTLRCSKPFPVKAEIEQVPLESPGSLPPSRMSSLYVGGR